MRTFLGILSILLALGCQTPFHKDLETIQIGTHKDDLVEFLGSPQRSYKINGVHRWVYVYYKNNNKTETEIHFQNQKVSYIGPKPRPIRSAEEDDRLNEESNRLAQYSIDLDRIESLQKTHLDPLKKYLPKTEVEDEETPAH